MAKTIVRKHKRRTPKGKVTIVRKHSRTIKGTNKPQKEEYDEKKEFREMLGLTKKEFEELEDEIGEISDVEKEEHNVWRIESDEGEWMIATSEDVAERMALDQVREDLRDEPSLFNRDFIESHFDTEQFINDIESDIYDMVWEEVKDDPESFGISEEDAEEENNRFENAVEDETKRRLDDIKYDPIDYLSGLGMEDKIYDYIDIDEAAEDAIAMDGWQHFLATYDGNSYELSNGYVFWRIN